MKPDVVEMMGQSENPVMKTCQRPIIGCSPKYYRILQHLSLDTVATMFSACSEMILTKTYDNEEIGLGLRLHFSYNT